MIWFVVLREGLADKRVGADLHFVAEAHRLFFVLIEGCAGNADDDDHNAEVDNVASVAAGIAVRQLHHGGEQALAGVCGDDFAHRGRTRCQR